jgi:hypothetical protein
MSSSVSKTYSKSSQVRAEVVPDKLLVLMPLKYRHGILSISKTQMHPVSL